MEQADRPVRKGQTLGCTSIEAERLKRESAAARWRRMALSVALGSLVAACSTLAPPQPGEEPGPAERPKVDTPAENASPAEAPGRQPAEEQPANAAPLSPAPPSSTPESPAPPSSTPESPAPPSSTPESPEKPPPAPDGTEKAPQAPEAPAKATDEKPTDSAAPPVTAPPEEEGILEQTRRTVRSTTLWLARGVDSWFGDKPFEQGGRVTDGRLGLALLKREDQKFDVKVRFNARFRLPNVQERTYLFLGRDNDRETVADTPGALSREQRLLAEGPDDRTFFAGLGYALLDAFDLRVGFHGIKPYLQARYRKAWNPAPEDLVEFRQTFFWRTSDHFGSTTALSYEHAYSSTLAFRWLTATTRTQKAGLFDWSSIAGVYKGFSGERLLSVEEVTSGSQHTGKRFTEYGSQIKWSQPIYRDWLFIECIGGLYWPWRPLESTRDRVWALGTSLTMRF
jgi:hypothetical protein